MAAKFFTGLPLDGPDPECVKGHGEQALTAGALAPAPRPSPDHSHRTAPYRAGERQPVPLTLSIRPPETAVRPPVTACDANPLAGFVPERGVARSRTPLPPQAREAPRGRPAAREAMKERGRVAVVTGAARGIGAATVLALAEAGWSVLAVDSTADDPALPYPMGTPAELSGVVGRANESAGTPGRVESFVADVRDSDAVTAAVAEAEQRWGGLDAAIAAAGVIAGGVPLWEVPPARQRAVLDVNLGGVLSLARAAVPALLRRPAPRSGRFLAVASAAATRGLPMLAAYCAAKAGVTGLIRALAAELADSGVTANAVSPGSTATAILDESARLYQLPGARAFASQQPMGRLLDPAEVAAVLAFLASPASSGMTGAVVPVDGGLAL